MGWKLVDGKSKPIERTKGGFRTKAEAVAYVPILKETVAQKMSKLTFEQLY